MSFPAFYLLPLIAGVGYALAAIFLKRAFSLQVGLLRSVFLSNLTMGLLFLPVALFGEGLPPLRDWVWPAICAVTFFCGQALTFLAVRVGDVTVQTPMMGTKVLMVAVFSFFLFQEPIPVEWWGGAFLATIAIMIMGVSDLANPRRLAAAIAIALLSSAFFALTDALVPHFAQKTGAPSFISLMFGINALLSCAMIPFFREPLSRISREAVRPLGIACGLNAAQALCMATALSFFGEATAVNILYSARGVWSVLLIGLLGGWVGIPEAKHSPKTKILRFLGTALLTVAVAMVLIAPR